MSQSPQAKRLSSPGPPLPVSEQEHALLEPFYYLCENPGKLVRTKLIEAFSSEWLRVPADKLKAITDVVEMLHTASLLIDDIEDGSNLRRGIPGKTWGPFYEEEEERRGRRRRRED